MEPLLLVEKGRHRARLAQDTADLMAARQLRSRCFQTAVLDQDPFDPHCHHVLIEDRTSGELVGCFRVLILETEADFELSYSAQFYDLAGLNGFIGRKMELGRFCIDPQRLDTDVLRLAWGAVTQLVDRQDIKLLFGCSSFSGTDPEHYLEAFALLHYRYQGPEGWRPAIKAQQVRRFVDLLQDRAPGQKPDLKLAQIQLPSLLRSYLSMGGWVGDHVVIDGDLNTCHVFTGLEIGDISARRKRQLREVAAPLQVSHNDPAQLASDFKEP
ncbi:GNAT family N-acetyltransferase [Pseudophaeobacter sp.]|uniref:GNAT family N-acetyltransferase n=1 Tax=Pseudophaeobacter sp. TaxID=1971739 RepID=UPI004058E01E